jgi:hypothetical protein
MELASASFQQEDHHRQPLSLRLMLLEFSDPAPPSGARSTVPHLGGMLQKGRLIHFPDSQYIKNEDNSGLQSAHNSCWRSAEFGKNKILG